MPKITKVEHCRQSPGKCGKCSETIEQGQPYVWWKFMVGGRGGPKNIRCGKPACYPKAKDLTQSEFWSTVYGIQEYEADCSSIEALESSRDGLVDELETLKGELEDKLSNMPDGLQQGATGELLQERIDALDECINELQNVDIAEQEREDEESDEDFEDRKAEHRGDIGTEISDALGNISCS